MTITLRDDSEIKIRTVIGRGREFPFDQILLIPLRVQHGYPSECSFRTGCTGSITRLVVAEIDGQFPVLLSSCEECYARKTLIVDPPSEAGG